MGPGGRDGVAMRNCSFVWAPSPPCEEDAPRAVVTKRATRPQTFRGNPKLSARRRLMTRVFIFVDMFSEILMTS